MPTITPNPSPDLRWRLYVRWNNATTKQKTFRPVDWRSGLQVGNLIYASVFTDSERAIVEKDLNATQVHNVGMEWEFRPV